MTKQCDRSSHPPLPHESPLPKRINNLRTTCVGEQGGLLFSFSSGWSRPGCLFREQTKEPAGITGVGHLINMVHLRRPSRRSLFKHGATPINVYGFMVSGS